MYSYCNKGKGPTSRANSEIDYLEKWLTANPTSMMAIFSVIMLVMALILFFLVYTITGTEIGENASIGNHSQWKLFGVMTDK